MGNKLLTLIFLMSTEWITGEYSQLPKQILIKVKKKTIHLGISLF